MPLFEMDNLVWTTVSKGFSNLKWTATGVTTLEKESGVPHHVTLEAATRVSFFSQIPGTKDKTWPHFQPLSDLRCDGKGCTNSLTVRDWSTLYHDTPTILLPLYIDPETHYGPHQPYLLDVAQMDYNMIIVNRQPMFIRSDEMGVLTKCANGCQLCIPCTQSMQTGQISNPHQPSLNKLEVPCLGGKCQDQKGMCLLHEVETAMKAKGN